MNNVFEDEPKHIVLHKSEALEICLDAKSNNKLTYFFKIVCIVQRCPVVWNYMRFSIS